MQPTETSTMANKRRSKSARNGIAEWAVTLLMMLFVSTSLAWSYVVPTGSMQDTILIGDHIIVDKLAYSPAGTLAKHLLPYQEPKHGDIFVFQYPVDKSQTLVKRVIGVPGDHIKIVNKQVFRNGRALTEPYAFFKTNSSSYYRDNFPAPLASIDTGFDAARDPFVREMYEHHIAQGEVIVPPASFFAMGDNRDNSLDSRYWGFVPRDNIVGKPVLIYWSYDAPTDELTSGSVGDLGRHLADMSQHFFTRTRWNRTLQLVHGYPDDPHQTSR